MATVSKELADQLVTGNGMYPGDHKRVVKIVKYENAWGGFGYGIVYEDQNPNMYEETEYVRKPVVYWEYKS